MAQEDHTQRRATDISAIMADDETGQPIKAFNSDYE